ncbi:hypothetical protein [Psychrobacter aquaticus]|uniref:Uncharacterized protein n=1 Tax=Psychrobacter aquaticus CMS 56 TaxID=1354303 RepID=U4T5T9_9GAMM|nr:hypothetical protein [Psychrobacter aquaticus]ERL56747.1 hypothetical protein M917_0377 [Psychrobacter aquaticus CMS 56]
MKTHQEVLVECWFDKTDVESIRQWACVFIEKNNNIPQEVFELLDAKKDHFEDILFRLSAAAEPDFSPQSLSAEILAAKYLINLIKKYLNDEITPMDICKVINNIDCGFMNAPRDLPGNVSYYPCWLGNLYSSCDWCDETWTNSNAPHLKQDIENQLPQIHDWIKNNQ